MNFVANLSYLLAGMLGIFIIIGVIVLATVILNAVTNRKSKKK